MYQKIFSTIRYYIDLAPSEEALIRERAQQFELKKGAFFLEMGQRNTSVSFLLEGLMRSYYYDEAGNEITAGFVLKDRFFTDLESFRLRIESERFIQTLADCKYITFNDEALQLFREVIPNWLKFEHAYISEILMQKIHFQRKIANSKAHEAYAYFVEHYQQAALFAPQGHIASFLGMSPFTLSRVRNG